MKKLTNVVVIFLIMSACASHTGVVAVGQDTFTIAKQQATGFPGLGNMKAEIIAEASQYCAERGKTIQIVSTHETQPPYVLGNYPRSEIQFTCVATFTDKNPEYATLKKLPVAAIGKTQTVSSEVRTALLIGNANYQNSPLITPRNDIRAIQAALKNLGFDVFLVQDAKRKDIITAIETFSNKLQARGGVGLMYYAGHGMQIKGKNFIVPIDANIQSEISGSSEAVDVDLLVDSMSTSNTRVNVIILDACRNNPFERRFRGSGRGLAPMNASDARGMLIAYSTAPGKTASDGEGQHSPYAQALSNVLTYPNLTIEQVFKRVREQVEAATNGAQTPWETSSLTGELVLN